MNQRVAALLSLPCLTIAHPAAAQRVALDLPAAPLGRAVDVLVHQAGTSVIIADSSLWDRPVPAVRGRMTAEAAVRMLARHAGADVTAIGTSGWRLTIAQPRRRVPARAPPPSPAAAIPTDGPDAEIVVLASKRGVGAEVFAGSVEMIAPPQVGIEGGTEALVTRSTIISSTYRGAGREKLFIRGLSDSGFSGRLQSVTGLYFGDVRLTYSAADPDLQLYDMQSVEVLQGPQGTLYGSGSLAGIIRMDPVMPRRATTEATIGGGMSATAHGSQGGDVDAMVNVPLTGNLAVRAVGYTRAEPGSIDKPALEFGPARDVNSTRIDGARAIVRWWIAHGWTVDATGIAQASRSRDTQYAAIEAPPLTDTSPIAEPFGSDYAAAHLIVRGRIGALDFTSATGLASQDFRERFYLPRFESAGIGDTHRRHKMLSHETRLSRRDENGSGWVAGVAYTRSESQAEFRERLFGSDRVWQVANAVSEIAMFGEGAVRVTPVVTVGAGTRVVQATSRSRFATSVDVGNDGRRRQWWLLPTASVVVRLRRGWSLYARYQEGARPAVIQSETLEGVNDGPDEQITTLDAGLRWQGDGGWMASTSVLHTRWRQVQVDTLESDQGFVSGTLYDWRVTSVQAALSGPVLSGLRMETAATINHAAPVLPLPGGLKLRLPDTADVIARIGATWTGPIGRAATLSLQSWVRYEGRSYGFFPNQLPQRQGDYFRTGITLNVNRDADVWSVSVDNLLDIRGNRYTLGSVVREGIVTPLRPFTARIGYKRRF